MCGERKTIIGVRQLIKMKYFTILLFHTATNSYRGLPV